MNEFWKDAEIIDAYSRNQAIEDGVLIDVSETAREAGLKLPTCITDHVFADCVALPADYHGCQDVAGRLWDVLSMTVFAIKTAVAQADGETIDRVAVPVAVRSIGPSVRDGRIVVQHLVAVCGPGDAGEPVITIMYPEDD